MNKNQTVLKSSIKKPDKDGNLEQKNKKIEIKDTKSTQQETASLEVEANTTPIKKEEIIAKQQIKKEKEIDSKKSNDKNSTESDGFKKENTGKNLRF